MSSEPPPPADSEPADGEPAAPQGVAEAVEPAPESVDVRPEAPEQGQPTEGDPVLDALWAKLVLDWDDEPRHQSLLSYCTETMRLDRAARLYRTRAEDEGLSEALREDARRRLAAVAMLAVTTMQHHKSEDPAPKGKRILLMVALVIFALMMLSVGYAIQTTLPSAP